MKKKNVICIAMSVLAIAVIIVTLFLVNKKLELPKLNIENVAKIYCYNMDEDYEIELNVEEFLGYYNQIYDIRNNKDDQGTTSLSKIIIELKDGTEIVIWNSGDQFEVAFADSDGKRYQYWGKQQEIANMLRHGVYGLN